MFKPDCLYISYDGLTEPLGQSQIIPYITGLAKKGIGFIVLTFDKKIYRAKRDEFLKIRRQLKKDGILWVSLTYHKSPRVFSTLFDVIRGLLVAMILVVRYNIKIVHTRSYVAALIAFFLKKLFFIKFIFDMRGFWADERIESGLWRKDCVMYKIAKYFEKRFLNIADEIVVLTKKAEDALRNLSFLKKKKIAIIPCSVDLNFFHFDSLARVSFRRRLNVNDKLIFLHIGSLECWYKLEDMLSFIKVVKGMGFNVHFVVLSHPHQKNNIVDLVRNVGLDTSEITITSAVYEEVSNYISSADVGLFFISPTPCRVASLPTKFAEYLSCGRAVVCNNKIGDLDSIIEENRVGLLIETFSKEEYEKKAKEMIELLRDNDLKHRCRHVASRLFSLESAVDKYYRIYKNL